MATDDVINPHTRTEKESRCINIKYFFSKEDENDILQLPFQNILQDFFGRSGANWCKTSRFSKIAQNKYSILSST